MWVDTSQSSASPIYSLFGASSIKPPFEVVEFYVPRPKPYDYLCESGPWVSRSSASGRQELENDDARKFAEKIIERLAPIFALTDNWDGRGAMQINQDSIRRALETVILAQRASAQVPHFVPTLAGGLQLEWHLRNLDIEIEMTPEGRIDFFLEQDGELSEWDGEFSVDKSRMMRELLGALAQA